MARRFRFYGKKRGHRRTGSAAVGSAGEALFFGLFLLLGCGGVVAIFLALVVPEWRVNHVFLAQPCVVRDKRIGETQGEAPPRYRPEIQIEYQVNGETYRTWTYDARGAYSAGRQDKQDILDRFAVGEQYLCWYNPADPGEAVVVRGYSWWLWLAFIVPGSFVLIGGGGLIYAALSWGKSAERRAAFAKQTARLDLFDAVAGSASEFPQVPRDGHITNSPGTTLAFRLPADVSSAWALVAALAACVFWNGIVAFFLFAAVRGHVEGRPDWLLTFVLIPFVVAGIGLIVFFLRRLLVATGIGPTLVEISDHPILPGQPYRVFLSQAGRLRFKALELWLICEEEATFRQGTHTRTETQRVFQLPVFRREQFEVHRGRPFEAHCELLVPPGVMHSFKSEHNEVNWKLLVKGDVLGWPGFTRSFPVVVYPALNGCAAHDRGLPAVAREEPLKAVQP